MTPEQGRWLEGVLNVLDHIRVERRSQCDKWGVRTQDHGTQLKILVEEVGEVAKAMLEYEFECKSDEEREAKLDHLRYELVQVAAVAATMIQQIDQGSA